MESQGDLRNNLKVTKTDVIANDRDFLASMEQILADTSLLKLSQPYIDLLLQSLCVGDLSQAFIQERITFVHALLSERKFFVNLIKSLLKRLL